MDRLPPLNAPASPGSGDRGAFGGRTLRLEEQEVPDDVFVLWRQAALHRLPNTLWRPAGADPPSHPKMASQRFSSTLRTALDGKHARPRAPVLSRQSWLGDSGTYSSAGHPSVSEEAPLLLPMDYGMGGPRPGYCGPSHLLDGDWFSREDGELRGRIEAGQLYWEEDGSATSLYIHTKRGDVVSMVVDGERHSGVLSEDGRILKWQDGDIWVRVRPENEVDISLSEQANASLEMEDYLLWDGWSNAQLMSHRRPTSKSMASAAYRAFEQRCFLEQGESPEALRPSAAFM